MKAACDVVVIGSSNIDMTVRCRDLPLPGQTIMGDSLVMTPGGKGANQAVAAAKLGARTQLVARLGDDAFGEASLQSFEAAGLGIDYVIRDQTSASGVALIFVDAEGENQIVVAPGANYCLSPDDVDKARPIIANAQVMVLQLEIPFETVRYAVSLAQEYKTRVILNPAPARSLPPALLEKVDIIIANETEVLILTGAADVQTSNAAAACGPLLEAGVETVITTLGREGAVVTDGVGGTRIPGYKVRAVDTTAAGDTFTGAVACGLAEHRPLHEAVAFANAAAALAATRHGAQISMPDRATVEQFVADRS